MIDTPEAQARELVLSWHEDVHDATKTIASVASWARRLVAESRGVAPVPGHPRL